MRLRSVFLFCLSLPLTFFIQSAHADEHDSHMLVLPPEPAPTLTLDAPIAALLAKGIVVLPFHTQHVRIMPVYGEPATHIQPRVGHLHITLDHASWHWIQSNDDVIVIHGLSPGLHHIKVELAEADHRVTAAQESDLTIP